MSNVLKRYFRGINIEEPWIPDLVTEEIKTVDQKTDYLRGKLKTVLDGGKYETMAYVIKYLKKIAMNSDINRMTAENLAICFAPNLFKAPPITDPKLTMEIQEQQNMVMELMISEYNTIFGDVSFEFCTTDEMDRLIAKPINVLNYQHQIIRRGVRIKSRIPYVSPLSVYEYNIKPPSEHPPPLASP